MSLMGRRPHRWARSAGSNLPLTAHPSATGRGKAFDHTGTFPAPSCFEQTVGAIPMSLFGAMNTAVSGLSAQSSAFGNISDNVANSQTVGYKRVDTSFIDYLTTSTAANNVPG